MEFGIVMLRGARGSDGRLEDVRFTYRGKDVHAQRDPLAVGWRVSSGGRALGVAGTLELDDERAVAEHVIGTLLA